VLVELALEGEEDLTGAWVDVGRFRIRIIRCIRRVISYPRVSTRIATRKWSRIRNHWSILIRITIEDTRRMRRHVRTSLIRIVGWELVTPRRLHNLFARVSGRLRIELRRAVGWLSNIVVIVVVIVVIVIVVVVIVVVIVVIVIVIIVVRVVASSSLVVGVLRCNCWWCRYATIVIISPALGYD